MSNALLEVKNLVVEFLHDGKYIRAVDDVSFSIEKGKTLGIVGESGSGKSVSCLSIMRLISTPPGKISQGQIVFQQDSSAIDLLTLSEKNMRGYRGKDIAMIFQEPMTSLNPAYTCGRQVAEAILLHQKVTKKQAKQKVLGLFSEVQLDDPEKIFYSFPHQLSGGQRQRVMIAMAISCNPKILIADEPTTALDVTIQKAILQLMKQLQQKHGMSLIFVSHDLGVIAEIADEVLVMYKGKAVERGAVKNVFTQPKHAYTKGLLACRPPLGRRLKQLPTVNDFLTQDSSNINTISDFLNQLVVDEGQRKVRLNSMYAKPPLLSAKNVKMHFPIRKGLFSGIRNYVKAVDDVSFDVFPGETLGLVGESGCGKTTLGRTLLRLIEPTSGDIYFNQRDILALGAMELRKLRKDTQIIFQDPYSSLNPRITVGSAIVEPMKVHKLHENDKFRKQKAIELLHKVGLDAAHYHRYPHEFSGGQRQRICIARALAVNPKFIICDECVSALDVSVQAQVLNLLNQLKHEFGFTYIFISHDLSVVKFMSDRMIVMNKGKIEEIDDADQVYSYPQSEYTRKLIDAIPKGIYRND